MIINDHQSSSIIINHHQSSSMITNHHQWSSRRRRRTGVNCHFFTKLGKLLTLAPDVRLRFLKKGKWSELNFRNFWPGFRHLRPNTNTQIRKDKYTITRITPFWNEVSYFPKQFILTNRWHTVHFQCSAVLWTSSSSPSSPSSSPSPSSWHCDAVQWHQYHHHHPITVCQIVVGQSPNVLTKISSHDWSNVLSEIFSPLFLIRGGGGDEKSLEKLESGTGVRKKLKILAWVPLVIVFFYI